MAIAAPPTRVRVSITAKSTLATCEKIISKGLETFVEVGNALLRIRDARLYRQGFDTFEDYCRSRWKMSKTHANRLVDAAEVIANLAPMGVNHSLPTSERQIRPLARLEPEQQKQAWQIANAISPNPAAHQLSAEFEERSLEL